MRVAMQGMSRTSGKAIDGVDHLAQSIGDILSTPVGSRVMLRDYGSLLFRLVDQPLNAATAMLLRAATATALRRWEPRIIVEKVRLSGAPADGSLVISITGARTDVSRRDARATLSISLPTILAS